MMMVYGSQYEWLDSRYFRSFLSRKFGQLGFTSQVVDARENEFNLALGRSRDGFSTKIHLSTNGKSDPLIFDMVRRNSLGNKDAMGLLRALGLFRRKELGLGQHQSFLSAFGFHRLEPGEFESEHPGCCGARDTSYVGSEYCAIRSTASANSISRLMA
jgi:hypothetical protein